jgi:hypothetical protein
MNIKMHVYILPILPLGDPAYPVFFYHNSLFNPAHCSHWLTGIILITFFPRF